MLPGHPDAAVQLDGFLRGHHGDVAAVGLCDGHRDRHVRVSPVARGAAAYWAAAAADSTLVYRSTSRCLRAWNPPTTRPNWRRILRYSTVVSKHQRATPTCSAASKPAPHSSARRIAREQSERTRRPGAASRRTSASWRVMSREPTGVTVAPAAATSYSAPPAATRKTSASSAPATLVMVLVVRHVLNDAGARAPSTAELGTWSRRSPLGTPGEQLRVRHHCENVHRPARPETSSRTAHARRQMHAND